MITDQDLQELLDLTSPDPILSVYLNTDLTEGSAEQFRLNLRTLLDRIDMPADESAILDYYRSERRWTGRSVAMFSCALQGFFRAFPLAVPVRSLVFTAEQPYVKPLADLLDSYGGYGAALVDQQGARLFIFHLGELIEQTGTFREGIKRTKRGGASTFPGRRGGTAGQTDYVDEAVERNVKDAVDYCIQYFEKHDVRHVLLGGTQENVRQFQSHLPKAWQAKVVGTFPMNMRADVAEVREKILTIGAQAEREREDRLVDRLITAAASGGEGVVRLDDTLGALREGRVQILIVREGYQAPAYQCQGCRYLTAQKLPACPFCGKPFEEVQDAVELAVREVMQTGGEVQIVHRNPDLEKVGIGGLLRY